MTTILFWDIDGTLLHSNGAGRLALQDAASELAGKPCDLSSLEMAGMTDWGISTTILESLAISPSTANIQQLWERYITYLPTSLEQNPGFVLEGVYEILEALHHRNDVFSVLLTGNIEAGAKAKLAHYKLDHFFTLGGFGETTADRCKIAEEALATVKAELGTVDLDKCYVIGDTPHDIRCGQAIGAKTIGIASSRYSVDDLTACKSWLVLESFPHSTVFLEKIGLS